MSSNYEMHNSKASCNFFEQKLKEANDAWKTRPTIESIKAELVTLQKTVNSLRKSLDKEDKVIDSQLLEALGSVNNQLVYAKTKYGVK